VIFIDACREQVKVDRRGTETHDATPLLKSMAEAKGQVVFYGAAPGCFAYDDDQRQNGVFTAALLDGLRCSAVADEQGLITVDALADFVNQRVLAWVRSHRDRSATQGIQVTVDRGTRSMALASSVGACSTGYDNSGVQVSDCQKWPTVELMMALSGCRPGRASALVYEAN